MLLHATSSHLPRHRRRRDGIGVPSLAQGGVTALALGSLVEGYSRPGICTASWLSGPADRADSGSINSKLRWRFARGHRCSCRPNGRSGRLGRASALSSGIARAGSTLAVAQAARGGRPKGQAGRGTLFCHARFRASGNKGPGCRLTPVPCTQARKGGCWAPLHLRGPPPAQGIGSK